MDFEMELEHEMTYDTASTIKAPDSAFVRNCGGTPPTDLNKLEAELNAELDTALESADALTIFDVRKRLAQLPLMRTAADIETTRNRLAEIESKLEAVKECDRLIRSVLALRKAELQAKIDELIPYREAYEKCVTELGFADNEIQMLRVARREAKSKLFGLTADLKNEK
jgi:hypothetical protein